jgi:hypothetical protein
MSLSSSRLARVDKKRPVPTRAAKARTPAGRGKGVKRKAAKKARDMKIIGPPIEPGSSGGQGGKDASGHDLRIIGHPIEPGTHRAISSKKKAIKKPIEPGKKRKITKPIEPGGPKKKVKKQAPAKRSKKKAAKARKAKR